MMRSGLRGGAPCVPVHRLLLAFLATTLVVGSGSAAPPQPALDVDIPVARLVDVPDAVLRAALEEALGKGAGEPITRGEMASLRELAVGGVKRLAGIEHAVNLVRLEVRRGEISDLAPLIGLTSLKELDLDDNVISDLGPLANLTALTSLTLDGNAIADVAPLAALTSLKSLALGGNAITEFEPLAGLSSLTSLELQSNDIADLAPLAGLTSLTALDLGFNDIADVAPLAGPDLAGVLGSSQQPHYGIRAAGRPLVADILGSPL